FENLLLHVVGMAALADCGTRQRGFAHWPIYDVVGNIAHRDAVAPHLGPVAFFEIEDTAGQRRQRERVGAQVHLAVAEPDRERRIAPRADQQIVGAREQDQQRERAFEPRSVLATASTGPNPSRRYCVTSPTTASVSVSVSKR